MGKNRLNGFFLCYLERSRHWTMAERVAEKNSGMASTGELWERMSQAKKDEFKRRAADLRAGKTAEDIRRGGDGGPAFVPHSIGGGKKKKKITPFFCLVLDLERMPATRTMLNGEMTWESQVARASPIWFKMTEAEKESYRLMAARVNGDLPPAHHDFVEEDWDEPDYDQEW